jgi:hypothetical protein
MSGRVGLSCRFPGRASDADRVHALEACRLAADYVKRAGLTLIWSSMKSEACYYIAPGRHGLLRIATHAKGGRNPDMKNGPTLVSLTFPEANLRGFTLEHIENHTANGIGLYLIRAAPAP